jgi:YegS/Rv2252/BmrU family lipid kinase
MALMVKKVHIIINPASGQPQPILNQINDVLHPADVAWNVSITNQVGDASRFTRQAIDEGAKVIGAYGGDGTVMEVAQAVQGGEIPMAILPGGTANLMSVELGIPKNLSKAVEIMIDPLSQIRHIDMGQMGQKRFMLRVGMGFAGEKVRLADRELKDRWGILAYSIAGLKALSSIKIARYRITVDGVQHEANGKTCLIDNAGNLGMRGLTISQKIDVSDGLLDVLLISDDTVGGLIAAGAKIVGQEIQSEGFFHWQGREIAIECDPPQTVQGDGEIWGQTPVSVQVLPGVLPIMTPASS